MEIWKYGKLEKKDKKEKEKGRGGRGNEDGKIENGLGCGRGVGKLHRNCKN